MNGSSRPFATVDYPALKDCFSAIADVRLPYILGQQIDALLPFERRSPGTAAF